MKTKGGHKEKVEIITLGCSKNLVDSEILLTQLKGNGVNASHVETSTDADVVVINTCGFIDRAKEESVNTILEYAKIKEAGDLKKLYVTGCLSQRYRDDLKKEIPEVDDWFGTMELPLILNRFKVDYKKELLGERLTSTQNHFAYLKIAEGCDRPCSFCAIPLMRGKHVSLPMEDLVAQAKGLARNGTKELLLIAQDSTYYGLDLYRERRLASLMHALADVDGIDWIRLHYAFPSGFPEDVMDAIASRPEICNYLDIPLQHGSTDVLKMMRRGISRPKTEELIQKIRQKIPGIAIRTTMMTGHPGETDKSFQEMVEFVQKMEFERLGIFTYSHEENTFAGDSYEDTIPEEVKQERADHLMAIQEEISLRKNSEKVGKEFKVLIDRLEGDYFIGRTEFDSPEVDNEVLFPLGENHLRIGDFVRAKVDDVESFDLFATSLGPWNG